MTAKLPPHLPLPWEHGCVQAGAAITVIQGVGCSVSALPLGTGLFLLPCPALVLSCAGSQGSAAGCKTGKQWLFLALPSTALQL